MSKCFGPYTGAANYLEQEVGRLAVQKHLLTNPGLLC